MGHSWRKSLKLFFDRYTVSMTMLVLTMLVLILQYFYTGSFLPWIYFCFFTGSSTYVLLYFYVVFSYSVFKTLFYWYLLIYFSGKRMGMLENQNTYEIFKIFLYILNILVQNIRKYIKEEFQIFLSIFKAEWGAISENAEIRLRWDTSTWILQKLPYWFQCADLMNKQPL